MKNLSCTVLFFLSLIISVSAQSSKSDSLLNVIESTTEQLRFELSQQSGPADPIRDLQVGFISPGIIDVTWTPAGAGKMDLQYFAPEAHTEWQHSFAAYLDSIDVSAGRAAIGVGVHSTWFVRASRPGWVSDSIEVEPWSEPKPTEEVLVGFWDSWNAPREMDMWKDYASRIDKTKKNLIVQIGNFQNGYSDSQIRSRISTRLVEADVLFYLMDDEPFLGSGKLSEEYWNHINDIVSEFDIPFGWSLSDNKVNNFDFYSEHEMIIPINTYLFFQPEYGVDVGRPWGGIRIETETEFREEADRVFNNARKKLPNSKFIFVAQGFSDKNKYRKPPVESVEWTHDYVNENSDIIGVLWYEWDDRTGTGLMSMPDLSEKIFEMQD